MTDLDTKTLRHALQPASGPAGTLDVALVMRRGRRLRTRRRLTVVAGSLCAAAILAGSVTAITNLTGPAQTTPSQPVGPVQTHTAQHGPDQPGLRNPYSTAPPRPQPSGVRPTSTPRGTSLPPAVNVPSEATPSPVISSPAPTASPTPTPTATRP